VGRRRGRRRLRRALRNVDVRLYPLDEARAGGRRDADEHVRESGGRARGCDATVGGDDVEDGRRRRTVRRREGGAGRSLADGGCRAPPPSPSLCRACRLARRELSDRTRREHHDGRHGRHRRAAPLRLLSERGAGRLGRPRTVHRPRRLPRDPRHRLARVRLARSRWKGRPRPGSRRRRRAARGTAC
jgi:hypothetical protein